MVPGKIIIILPEKTEQDLLSNYNPHIETIANVSYLYHFVLEL